MGGSQERRKKTTQPPANQGSESVLDDLDLEVTSPDVAAVIDDIDAALNATAGVELNIEQKQRRVRRCRCF